MDEKKKNNFRKNIIYEKSSVEKLIERVKHGEEIKEISKEDFCDAVEWYCKEIIKNKKETVALKKKLEELKKKNNK